MTDQINEQSLELPGAHLDINRMPGHWLLARMGKRVLRPGGMELTQKMLEGLRINSSDDVVELAPGLGTTARLVIASQPATYTGVDRDKAAVKLTERILRPGRDECRQGAASETGLDSASKTVVLGEAMLTMQSDAKKSEIVREAFRVLKPGGRYGIHELGLAPDSLPDDKKAEIQRALSDSIHVGARPLTVSEWRNVLEKEGFEIVTSSTNPMALLEPKRIISDEGVLGALRILFNIIRTPGAKARIRTMRAVFHRYSREMCGVTVVARKPVAVTD